MESKPAAIRSVSAVTPTSGAKTSCCTKASSCVSIWLDSIMLADGDRAADFGRRGAGEFINYTETRWDFQRREAGPAEIAHGLEIDAGLSQDDFSLDGFAQMRVAAAIGTRLDDGGMSVKHGFNFFREHFSARQIDHG